MIATLVAKVTIILWAFGVGGTALEASAGSPPLLQGGVVEGLVYDSTTAKPLVGARVFLWNTSLFAETNDVGYFQMENVPEGDYDLVFFHPRLTDLGVSSGRTPVKVDDDRRVSVALTTPSMMTIMSLLCLAEDPMGEQGRAIGYVGDASTRVPLPGARVLFVWELSSPDGRRLGSAQETTDGDGWYSACTVPAGVEIEGTAYFMGQETQTRRFEVSPGLPSRVDFSLGDASPATISGELRDAETHRPIPDVEIELPGPGIRAVTNRQGRFSLEDVPPGSYVLNARHLAYGERADPIELSSGQDVDVTLELATRAIELEPMVVTVRSKAEAQALAVGGRLISRAQIDEVRSTAVDMGDLLQVTNTPGLVISRGGTGMCLGFRRGQVTMNAGGCLPAMLYINDVPASDPTLAVGLAPEVIDRIIIVPPIEAGVLYSTGSAAGVILIYTRSR